VPFNFGERRAAVYVDRSGEVPVYFIDAPQYFSRANCMARPMTPSVSPSSAGAVLELAKALGEHFDIIHLNDWMTGLVATYLKTVYPSDPAFDGTKTLFTVHNIAFPGLFRPDQLPKFGLPDWLESRGRRHRVLPASQHAKSGAGLLGCQSRL